MRMLQRQIAELQDRWMSTKGTNFLITEQTHNYSTDCPGLAVVSDCGLLCPKHSEEGIIIRILLRYEHLLHLRFTFVASHS